MKNRKIPEEKSRYFRVNALIIQSQSFGEGHRRLTLVAKNEAKINVPAFGAAREKSQRRSSLLVGQHILATLNKSSQGMLSVKESELIDDFGGIRENYKRSSWFFIIAEVLNISLKTNAGFQKYPLLIETLQKIETSDEPEKYALYFLLSFLLSEGYLPRYSDKIIEELKTFTPKNLRIGNGSLRFLRDVENTVLDGWTKKSISASVVTNICDILQACVRFHFQRNIRAFSLLINAE